MENIKYIALDLDGTLTNSNKDITPKTRDSLIAAQKAGYKLILASGRPTAGLYKEAKELQMDVYGGYLVSFNGAKVHEYPSMKCFKSMALSVEEAQSLVQRQREMPQFSIMTYSDTHVICEDIDAYKIKDEAKLNNMPIQVVENIAEYIDHPVNKLLFAIEPENMGTYEEEFKKPFPHLSLYCSTPFYLEAMTNGIDKAESLQELLKDLGASVDNLMAFGDGYNDFKMIKAAHIGVCMGNGDPRVKEIADIITKTNDEDGICDVIDQLLQ